jgi:hypothetical protein
MNRLPDITQMTYVERMALAPTPKRGGRQERELRAIGCACVGFEERVVRAEEAEMQGGLFHD